MVHNDNRANMDPIAVVQCHDAGERRLPHLCAILAAEIFDVRPLVADDDPRVSP